MQAISLPSGVTALPARRAAARPAAALAPRPLRNAPVARPSPLAPSRGEALACEALGVGAVGAGVNKVLSWLGIKGGAKAVAAAATAAASDAATQAAAIAAVKAALKFLWPALLGIVAVGAVLGAAAYHFGLPQLIGDAVNKLLGKPGLTLWSNPASRGQIVAWYLKELGVDATIRDLDMKEKREHKGAEFLAVNPWGKLPAISDGSFNLFESGALLLYIADKYPAKSGIHTPKQRAAAAQWVLFANSTLANSVFVEQFREKAFPDVFGTLNKVLGEREWLEQGRFTVSDLVVGAYLLYIPAFLPQLDLTPYPNVLAYMKRLAERPACAATVAARAGARKEEEVTKAAVTTAAA